MWFSLSLLAPLGFVMNWTDIFTRIRSLCQQFKDNNKVCSKLLDQVSFFEKVLKSLEKDGSCSRSRDVDKHLANIKTCCENIVKMVDKYSKTSSLGRVVEVIKGKSFEEEVEKLNTLRSELNTLLHIEDGKKLQAIQDNIDGSKQKNSISDEVDSVNVEKKGMLQC